ncbi:MAG: bifunctional glutamate N-acetyltransferase/amino-acid acetyltransferase ArgJ [Defluviitaleaceae bacterium]|nr:bifunctional glutamate N-acetyltransferase/amino-acid acetyltransferase ArgJ [Defluviitaleaceae bacterium]
MSNFEVETWSGLSSGGITAVPGFKVAGVHCGIRKNRDKRDLALIVADRMCSAAAVYTTNKVKGAPLLLTMEHLSKSQGKARAILCNSGNANTCAPDGLAAATTMVNAAAKELDINPSDIIVNSTGVIGVKLPVDAILAGMPKLVKSLSRDNIPAAEAIMTTDTFSKSWAAQFELGGKTVTLGGIAKGSGMIHPNMATMLSFLATDCAITPEMLQKALKASTIISYNQVSVDGDTSTNDMCAILASGTAGNPLIDTENEDYNNFLTALNAINLKLAKEIARDGEGATKLLICRVNGAKTFEDASKLSKSIIGSSLVKSAMFGADANWGRVLCAMGYSGASFDPMRVDVSFSSAMGDLDVCKQSTGLDFDESMAKGILSEKEVTIEINLSDGNQAAEAYGCDLTYDYVRINGDYRT